MYNLSQKTLILGCLTLSLLTTQANAQHSTWTEIASLEPTKDAEDLRPATAKYASNCKVSPRNPDRALRTFAIFDGNNVEIVKREFVIKHCFGVFRDLEKYTYRIEYGDVLPKSTFVARQATMHLTKALVKPEFLAKECSTELDRNEASVDLHGFYNVKHCKPESSKIRQTAYTYASGGYLLIEMGHYHDGTLENPVSADMLEDDFFQNSWLVLQRKRIVIRP